MPLRVYTDESTVAENFLHSGDSTIDIMALVQESYFG